MISCEKPEEPALVSREKKKIRMILFRGGSGSDRTRGT